MSRIIPQSNANLIFNRDHEQLTLKTLYLVRTANKNDHYLAKNKNKNNNKNNNNKLLKHVTFHSYKNNNSTSKFKLFVLFLVFVAACILIIVGSGVGGLFVATSVMGMSLWIGGATLVILDIICVLYCYYKKQSQQDKISAYFKRALVDGRIPI